MSRKNNLVGILAKVTAQEREDFKLLTRASGYIDYGITISKLLEKELALPETQDIIKTYKAKNGLE